MKKFLFSLFVCLTGLSARADVLESSYTTHSITIPEDRYVLYFTIHWTCNEYPITSTPGRVELVNSQNQVVGWAEGHVSQSGATGQTNRGSVEVLGSNMSAMAHDLSVADGGFQGIWHISGVPAGSYTLRFWDFTNAPAPAQPVNTVWTHTFYQGGHAPPPANRPPIVTLLSPGSQSVTSGTALTLTSHAIDPDGNISSHNLDIQRPAGDWNFQGGFATGEPYAGGPVGSGADSTRTAAFTFTDIGTYYVRSAAFDGTDWAHSATVAITVTPPANTPPTVTLIAPSSQTITAGTTLTLSSRATDPDGNITGHNLDIQRPAGDWNFQGGFAVGEPYAGGPVGSGGDSSRAATFTFSDVGTYYVRSAATDGSGWYHSTTVAITVTAPPPPQYTLTTLAGTGGTVSPGGTFVSGTTVYATATPDAAYDFAGWSGDATGSANPLSVIMDRSKTVRGNFTLKTFTLTTWASGGSVTPGGTYPFGTIVTISAIADATHRFVGWAGDASGSASAIAVTMNGPKSVQAVFETKAAQTITFASPGDQNVGTSVLLAATASSGLPVGFTVLNGSATLNDGTLVLTGPGAITVQATQPGDGTYLAAPPVTRTFNAAAPAMLKYTAAARTLLQSGATSESIPYVVQP